MSIVRTDALTMEQYFSLPEGPPYFEFEDGELIPMTTPSIEHQEIADELVVYLRRHVNRLQLGRVFRERDLVLANNKCYIPDILFLSNERAHLLEPNDQIIYGAPDLVIEITSKQPWRDRGRRFNVYAENGVPWYWIIDPIKLSIDEYKLVDAEYLEMAAVAGAVAFSPALFPGLVIDLAALIGSTQSNASE